MEIDPNFDNTNANCRILSHQNYHNVIDTLVCFSSLLYVYCSGS